MSSKSIFTGQDLMVCEGRYQSALRKLLDSVVPWKLISLCNEMILKHNEGDYIVIKKVGNGHIFYCRLFCDENQELNPRDLSQYYVVHDPRR